MLYAAIIILALSGVGAFALTAPVPDTGNIILGDADDPSKGAADAPVTIVEFGHHECPFCARYHFNTEPLIEQQYIDSGQVRYVFKTFPVASYGNSFKSSEAVLCAHQQGLFWEYNDILFKNQGSLSIANLKQYASELGLNIESFNSCLDSGSMAGKVRDNVAEGQLLGVRGTPSFLINGELVVGAQPFSVFQQKINSLLAVEPVQSVHPPQPAPAHIPAPMGHGY